MQRRTRPAAAALGLALCLALAPSAFARDAAEETRPSGESYARFQFGVGSYNDETSWSVYGTYGRYILNNVALEGSVGYYSTDYSYGDMTVWPLSLSIKAGFPVQRFFPYAIAGVDLQYIDEEYAGRSDSDTAIGCHLGAGVEFSLSRNVYAGVEYRYTFIEANLFGVERDLDGDEIAFTIGVRF